MNPSNPTRFLARSTTVATCATVFASACAKVSAKVCAAGLLVLSGTAWAQAASAPQTPRVDQRQAQQNQRIEQGVASGELTKPEARRLRHQQANVARAEDKAKADGTVTAQERHRLGHMQDHSSRAIARQKHDRQHRPGTADSGAGSGSQSGK